MARGGGFALKMPVSVVEVFFCFVGSERAGGAGGGG